MKKKTKWFGKLLFALKIVFIVVLAGIAVYAATFDPNKLRPQIEAALSERTGRVVKLGGPIHFGVGGSGGWISVGDVSISNPSWASRPEMAGIGKLELGVRLLPILERKAVVDKLKIENADILLETNAEGQNNWDFGKPAVTASSEPAVAPSEAPQAKKNSFSLSVDNLKIVNSQIAFRDAEGKTTSLNVSSLGLQKRDAGAEVTFDADLNGTPLTADLKTTITDLFNPTTFKTDADMTYAGLHAIAHGDIDIGKKTALFSPYTLSAGKSKITGNADVMWGGAKPKLKGTAKADYLNPLDFKLGTAAETTESEEKPGSAQQPAEQGGKRIFSDQRLPFDALKSADADFSISIGDFLLGKGSLKNISTQLVLSNGKLSLSPIKASLGDAPFDAQLVIDASQTPPKATLGVIATNVDLGDLQKIGDMASFMRGKAGANIQVESTGNTLRDLASSLGGVVSVTAEKGEILSGTTASISSFLVSILSPTGGDNAINCLAVRFIVKNGVMNDNGILIDSAATTIAGKGQVNLGSETIKLTLFGSTKLVDIGGVVPAVDIAGNLADPKYSLNTQEIVTNAVSSIMNGNPVIINNTNVPEIQPAPEGQNACVYTLDHPKKPAGIESVLPTDSLGKAKEKLKSLGTTILKGLFGQ